MESTSTENMRRYFGFSDLRGFKDFIIYVYSYAPDGFPSEDWRSADEQMNLDRAFAGIRYGLDLTQNEKARSDLVAECRQLAEMAYVDYKANNDYAGQLKLERLERLLSSGANEV